MFIIKHRKIFFTITAILVGVAIFVIFSTGIRLGIDFTGGSITEVSYSKKVIAGEDSIIVRPDLNVVNKQVEEIGIGTALIQPTEESGYIIRSKELNAEEHTALLSALSLDDSYTVTEDRFSSIGPSVGAELRSKAWVAIAIVILVIILLIAYVFRQVSVPVSSWKYGVIAVITLAHDIIIPTGIYVYLGYEIDSLFVIAILAILGLSVNDTIVVFDRIRENLKNKISIDFSETVGRSLEQTFVRSINTSLTVIIVLVTLYLFGPISTQHFALVLALGMFFGTYSSIFLASPLLVTQEKQNKKDI